MLLCDLTYIQLLSQWNFCQRKVSDQSIQKIHRQLVLLLIVEFGHVLLEKDQSLGISRKSVIGIYESGETLFAK